MPDVTGRRLPLSPARRMVADCLHAARFVPTVPLQKNMDLAELAAARDRAEPRPSWCAIFTKAYGKVVAAQPVLRRACLSFPAERLVEYSPATVDIVVEAKLDGEDILVNHTLEDPGSAPLLEIDRGAAALRERPYEGCRRLRIALGLARWPRFVRRLAWWYVLNASGHLRGRIFGTYAVSSAADRGVDTLRPVSAWTTLLHYGVVDSRGRVAMRLTFDHRVMDSGVPAQALNEMEHILKTDILAEVRGLQGRG